MSAQHEMERVVSRFRSGTEVESSLIRNIDSSMREDPLKLESWPPASPKRANGHTDLALPSYRVTGHDFKKEPCSRG